MAAENRRTRRRAQPTSTAEPIRKQPITVDTMMLPEPYSGWWITARTNPPLGVWLKKVSRLLALEGESDINSIMEGLDCMFDAIAFVAVDWNYVDEDGNELPCNEEAVRNLPSDILGLTFKAIQSSIELVPLGSSSN